MILVVGESVPVEFFTARTAQGHWVVYAFGRAVAIALNNGAIFKRLKYLQGTLGHKVDIALSDIVSKERWNGKAELAECSEREWIGVEEMAATMNALPPPMPEAAPSLLGSET